MPSRRRRVRAAPTDEITKCSKSKARFVAPTVPPWAFEHLSDSLNLIKKKEVQEAGTHRRITKCRGRQQFHFASRAQRRAQSAYPYKASVARLALTTHRAPGSRCQKLDRQTPGMLELSPCRPRKFWCHVRHFLEFDRVRQVVVVLSR